MTKLELIGVLNELSRQVSDEIDSMETHLRALKKIQREIDNLPSESEEIEDDNPNDKVE